MKILMVLHQFFPNNYTGTERLTLNLGKQIQRMGHHVSVLTYGQNDAGGYRNEGNCLVKEYEYQGLPVISIKHTGSINDASISIFDPDIEKISQKILTDGAYDIVHVLHPMRVGSVIRAAKRKSIPVVLSPTDFWLMCPKVIAITNKGELCQGSDNGHKCVKECYDASNRNALLKRREESSEVFKTADCIVSATYFLSQVFKNDGVTSPMIIFGYGIDYSYVQANTKIYSENSELTLGFLSTLLPHKGAEILLKAFNLAKLDNIKLKIYGDHFNQNNYYRSLKNIVRNTKNVEFCGPYKFEEMTDILNEIDLLVVPSLWWENSPLVVLRSLAQDVPVITSNLGGLIEIVKEGENGFTFEAGNAEDLATILRKIGENPCILNKIKSKIHHPPRIEETAFEYENIYLSLLEKRKNNS